MRGSKRGRQVGRLPSGALFRPSGRWRRRGRDIRALTRRGRRWRRRANATGKCYGQMLRANATGKNATGKCYVLSSVAAYYPAHHPAPANDTPNPIDQPGVRAFEPAVDSEAGLADPTSSSGPTYSSGPIYSPTTLASLPKAIILGAGYLTVARSGAVAFVRATTTAPG